VGKGRPHRGGSRQATKKFSSPRDPQHKNNIRKHNREGKKHPNQGKTLERKKKAEKRVLKKPSEDQEHFKQKSLPSLLKNT